MTTDRLALLPDVMARVECGGLLHGIRWTGGDLVALDHDDPEGERALHALGGASQTCIDVLDAWARYRSEPKLLSALSRGTGDYLQMQTDLVAPGPPRLPRPRRSVVAAYAPLVASASARYGPNVSMRPAQSDDAGVGVLAVLGPIVSRRLVATTTEALLRTTDSSMQPALEASLFGRVTASLRAWSGRPDLEVDLEVADPDDASVVVHGEKLLVRVPLEWVSTVWARGLDVVGDRFALAVLEAATSHVSIRVVDTSLEEALPVVVQW